MNDTETRLEQLERSLRRLRLTCAGLSLAVVGAISMAAAPAAPADLKVGKLTADSIAIEGLGGNVRLSASGLVLMNGNVKAELDAHALALTNGPIEAKVKVDSQTAYIGVASMARSKPASASLRVSDFKDQDPSPQLLVSDGKDVVWVTASTKLP